MKSFLTLIALFFGTVAFAGTQQIPLSEKLVNGFVLAQTALAKLAGEIQNGGEVLSPSLAAKLERVARASGFSSFDELDSVAYSIAVVLQGLDRSTGVYKNPRSAILQEIAKVEADKELTRLDRDELVAELRDTLERTEIALAGNVVIVARHRERIFDILR